MSTNENLIIKNFNDIFNNNIEIFYIDSAINKYEEHFRNLIGNYSSNHENEYKD